MLVAKLAGAHVERCGFPFLPTFVVDASLACRMLVVKLAGMHADRRRFPAAAPDTMPLMIGDDGCVVGAGILAPRLDAPELAEALLPTAQIPINMAALTTAMLLFLWFISPNPTGCVIISESDALI